jgi:hypothetical protein
MVVQDISDQVVAAVADVPVPVGRVVAVAVAVAREDRVAREDQVVREDRVVACAVPFFGAEKSACSVRIRVSPLTSRTPN